MNKNKLSFLILLAIIQVVAIIITSYHNHNIDYDEFCPPRKLPSSTCSACD